MARLTIGALTVVVLIALSPGQAFAAQQQCGDTITVNTKVRNDLTNCAGDGLVIGASNITLDLNGRTIDGTGNGSGVNNGAGYDSVTIKNGAVKEFQENVTLNGASWNQVANLTVSNGTSQGIVAYESDHNRIERNAAFGNGLGIDGDGIHLDVGSNYNVVGWNSSHDNATTGITVKDGSEHNTVVGNAVTRNPNRGIAVSANTNAVLSNVVGDAGIFLNFSNGSRVEGNFSYGVDRAGIGLQNSSNNAIRGNTTTRNSEGIGIHEGSQDNVIQRNWSSGNSDFGIQVDLGSTGNSILNNVANANGAEGIHVDQPLTTVTGNTANRNGGFGIYAPGAVDGGGNTAHDNGLGDCVGVSCT